MKKDVLAVTAVAVAIVIMVVAMCAMCAGPAQAAGPIHPKEGIEAQNRGYLAAHPCRDAIQAVTMREWEWLVTGVFTKHRTYGIPVPVTVAVEHMSRDWKKPDVYEPMPVELLGAPIIKPRSDVVMFKTEDGTSTCTARYIKTIDQIDDQYDEWNWVIESVSVKGVGTVSVQNGKAEKAEKKARKASVARR